MKCFKALFLILNLLLVAGLVVSPKFCEKHHVDDYCWMDENIPYGGPGTMDD